MMAPGFDGETLAQAITSTRILFGGTVFIGLALFGGAVLNSFKDFAVPALGLFVQNTVLVVGLIALLPLGVTGLSWATLIGFAAPFLLQLPFIIRKGMRYEPSIRLGDPDVRKVAKLAVPLVVGGLAGEIYRLVDRGLASTLVAGSIAALGFADKLRQLPMGLLSPAISAVVYSNLAEMAARRDRRGLEETIALALRMVAMIILPAAAGLAVLRVPIVALLFERGAFDRSSTEVTAAALLYYSIGMLPMAAVAVMQTVFYSLQDTATPVVITLAGAALNIGLDFFLVGALGHGGIALANSVTVIVVMAVMLAVLVRRVGSLGGGKLVLSLGKIAAASSVMGLVAFVAGREIGLFDAGPVLGLRTQLVRVGAIIGSAGAVYALCLVLFRVDEVAAGRRWVERRLKRRYATGG